MKIRQLLAASVGVAVLAPAAALASLPHAKSDLIVINKSIGGVTLNSSYAKAHAAWGLGGTCTKTAGCEYMASKTGTGAAASFMIGQTSTTAKPKVIQIGIRAGTTKSGTYVFNTTLDNEKTAAGIGLGSTSAQVKKAYKSAKALPGDSGYYIKGTGAYQTTLQTAKGRVIGIYMQSVRLG